VTGRAAAVSRSNRARNAGSGSQAFSHHAIMLARAPAKAEAEGRRSRLRCWFTRGEAGSRFQRSPHGQADQGIQWIDIEHAGAEPRSGPHAPKLPALVQRTLRSQTCELGVPGRIEPCEGRLHLAKTDHPAHALTVSTDEAGPFVHENRLDPRAEPLERAPHLSGNGETAELTEHLAIQRQHTHSPRRRCDGRPEHLSVRVRISDVVGRHVGDSAPGLGQGACDRDCTLAREA
jgi:hypothetical protein